MGWLAPVYIGKDQPDTFQDQLTSEYNRLKKSNFCCPMSEPDFVQEVKPQAQTDWLQNRELPTPPLLVSAHRREPEAAPKGRKRGGVGSEATDMGQ